MKATEIKIVYPPEDCPWIEIHALGKKICQVDYDDSQDEVMMKVAKAICEALGVELVEEDAT